MASLRVLSRLRLLRRGPAARSPAPAWSPAPARSHAPGSPWAPPLPWPLHAHIRGLGGGGGLGGRLTGGWGSGGAGHDGIAADGGAGPEEDGGAGPEEDGDAGPEEDGGAELLLGPEDEEEEPLFPVGGPQRVCIVHPDFRGPGGRTSGETERDVAEAAALVRALPGWSVARTLVAPAGSAGAGSGCAGSGRIFGKGNFRALTEKIRACPAVTCVFLDVERTAALTQRELEAAWGVPVLDRFALVLRVFRCHARSREARLQLALAELPLLRSSVDSARQEGRGSRYILGSGESPAELRRRALRAREAKLTRALERVRAKRAMLRGGRRGLPVVAVVGYTNCGKTTLVRALTGDPALRPRARPCSTLDVTAHAGRLACGAPVLYVDTVGFLQRLPHGLVHAFAATLGDVAHADLLLHVCDASHPDAARQRAAVLSALRGLGLPHALLASALEVHNKADLVPGSRPPGPGALSVSALHGHGLDELRAAVEEAVLRVTGTRVLTLRVPLGGPQLSWLHREASVQRVRDAPGAAGSAHVTVAIARAALGRFRRRFPGAQEVGGQAPPPGEATPPGVLPLPEVPPPLPTED